MPETPTLDAEKQLRYEVRKYYADPLGFTLFGFPWKRRGFLKYSEGPCPCQVKILTALGEEVRARKFDGVKPVKPIRLAVSSGHGIGKSAAVGQIVNWISSTRPLCQGTITANTFTQLQTKTWAAIQSWTKLCITNHWFTVTGDRLYQTGNKESWFFSAQSCREENSEAFAGQHAATSSSVYIFDEASAVPDEIFEVAEGGLTDGEPFIIMFGNPTKSTGKFHRAVFGSERDRWRHVIIDSRECPLSNKDQIQEWVDDYGEDSDFVRVRVRGLAPKAADSQFIDMDLVTAAQKRTATVRSSEPLVVGVDFAWGGDDKNTIRFRRGVDARSIPPIRIPGEHTRDPNTMTLKLAEILTNDYQGRKVSMMFLDSAGIAGPVAQRLRELGHKNILEINFGAHAPTNKCANMRSYMWDRMKQWMATGAIDKSVELEEDLTAPGYKLDRNTKVVLEPKDKIKARLGRSTDDGDALALTFAMPVSNASQHVEDHREFAYQSDSRDSRSNGSWMA